ncbi:hypothetical protein CIHG_07393 [Coccidioides immitis H538.4]|uniref:Uncharacterized protein n=3 Tax=Coccidioides immitis TaxID=5501 RepID=A0A0J8TQ83_COCIT|nr:hypothetical protein CIRG_00725 [Coccidioides immitis RMSCC 2394]KMU75897.1 hypothetical protein CISG_05382 [Coccidioides immitis RMSCC 3703]KMU89587.1 hypothetical protein CIHG_07393 [Coccidioides immitis H538.4]
MSQDAGNSHFHRWLDEATSSPSNMDIGALEYEDNDDTKSDSSYNFDQSSGYDGDDDHHSTFTLTHPARRVHAWNFWLPRISSHFIFFPLARGAALIDPVESELAQDIEEQVQRAMTERANPDPDISSSQCENATKYITKENEHDDQYQPENNHPANSYVAGKHGAIALFQFPHPQGANQDTATNSPGDKGEGPGSPLPTRYQIASILSIPHTATSLSFIFSKMLALHIHGNLARIMEISFEVRM